MTVLAAVGLVASCTTDDAKAPTPSTTPLTIAPLAQVPDAAAEPIPTMPYPPGYVPADTRGVELPVVPSAPLLLPPVPVFGGHAKLEGTVTGPDGPVEGATVYLERFVGQRGGNAKVTSARGGHWEADEIYGGHYRVRAWLEPDLATLEPQVGFVVDEENRSTRIDLSLEKHDQPRLQAALAIGDPKLDQPVVLNTLLDREKVNKDGIVIGDPIPDIDVDLVVGDGLEVVGEPKSRTGLDGFARFTITCKTEGPHDVTVTAGELTATVTLPECKAPEDAGTTTSTAAPDEEAPNPEFALGDSFKTPFEGPIPAGVYVPVGEVNSCATDFEIYVGPDWAAGHADRTITVGRPARKLQPTAGSPPCTFRRTR